MPEESLLVERRGRVLYLTLNRPQRHNALDFELLERLTGVIKDVAESPFSASSVAQQRSGDLQSPALRLPPNDDLPDADSSSREAAHADRAGRAPKGYPANGTTVPTSTSTSPPRPEWERGLGGEGIPAVIVLRGAGDHAFSAGFDVNLLTGTETDLDADDAVGGTASAIQTCPLPVIAAIHGFCFGAGFDLAMACDLRVASDDSTFALPAVRLGVVYRYDLIADLIAMCGLGRTRDLLFAMPTLSATEARSWGLLTDVVPAAELAPRVDALAEPLANAPETAVRGTKETIRLLATDSVEGEELEELRRVAAIAPGRQQALTALRERLGIE